MSVYVKSKSKHNNGDSKIERNYSRNISYCLLIALQLFRYSWKKYLMVIFVAVILTYTYFLRIEMTTVIPQEQIYSNSVQEVYYLINTSNCRIPNSDPFNSDIINFLVEEKPSSCSEHDLLTYIDKSNGGVTLNVNQSLLKVYSSFKVRCCYSNVTRINYEVRPDDEIKLTACTPFQYSVNLTFPFVRVDCYDFRGTIYSNVHATTLPLVKKTIPSSENPKFSFLLLGIDSMSKSGLKRTMPKTSEYLERHMHNLRGYNKVGDNTFPNLMPILTGRSLDQLSRECNHSVKLNECQFIWDEYKKAGYVTAYAEDECVITTFNFDRPGFLEEPTDFYYHPYFLAAEQLPVKKRHGLTYCAGPETSGERILNAAKDFAVTLKDTPSFGLFWSNSFSHDDINMPAVMDEPIYNLLTDPEFLSALNETIMIFFSDHGFRFGEIRYTHTGWLEERLPFIYVHIPEKFKVLFPSKYKNFLTNTGRLTSNFDLYNTFQDILEIGNDSFKSSVSEGCPKCHSLFSEIPEDRTCEDASIEQHFCTCNGHSYINPNNYMAQSVAQFVVRETNRLVKSFAHGRKCYTYSFSKVRSAGVSAPYNNNKNQTVNYYLVMVETKPAAIFEATVEVNARNELKPFVLLGDVSRIDRYGAVTACVSEGGLKKYCYCKSLWAYLISFF